MQKTSEKRIRTHGNFERGIASGEATRVVPGAGFEPATSGLKACAPVCSPDYESGALARLGYPGFCAIRFIAIFEANSHYLSFHST